MATNSSRISRQLSRLVELNHLSARLNTENFLQTLVEMASDLTGSEHSAVLAYNLQSNCMEYVAAPYLILPALKKMSVPINGSLAGEAFLSGEPIIINEAGNNNRLFRLIEEVLGSTTQKITGVPVQFRGETLGVLIATNKQDGDYTHEDVAFLQSLAAHAGSALHINKLEAQANKLNLEMQKLEEYKEDFIAITSHELRTPLGLILGHGTFLRAMMPASEFRPQIDAIITSAIRLKEIIESLTYVDNIQTGNARLRLNQVDMAQLVEDVTTSFQETATHKKLHLTCEIENADLVVDGEADKLVMAVSNILRNALAFTDAGGFVHVYAQKIPGYVQVGITDTGIGISVEEQERIFERFYQVEDHMTRRHGGMGLGLAVARDMVNMHGGQIWVKSEKEKGSTFSFIIPEKQT